MGITNPVTNFVAVFNHESGRVGVTRLHHGGLSRDRVVLWQELEDGTVCGLIIDSKTGRLRSATSYSNFVRYEPDTDCDYLVPAPAGMTAVYEDHIEDIHYIQVCNGESTLLMIGPEGMLFPISSCDDCVHVQVRLPETTLNSEESS